MDDSSKPKRGEAREFWGGGYPALGGKRDVGAGILPARGAGGQLALRLHPLSHFCFFGVRCIILLLLAFSAFAGSKIIKLLGICFDYPAALRTVMLPCRNPTAF